MKRVKLNKPYSANLCQDIGITYLPSRSKAGRAAWRLNLHTAVVGGKPEHFDTEAEALSRRNMLIGGSLESGLSKSTFAAAAADRVAVYKRRYENVNDKLKYTGFKDSGESANFWNKFFGSWELNEITPSVIRGTISELLETKKPKTIKNRFSFLKNVFKYAVGDDLCMKNPCDAINLVELIGSTKATKHQASRFSKNLIAEIIRHGGSYAMHITFAVKTGLRSGEQRGLKWKHIDMDAGFVTVEQAIVLGENGLEIGPPKTDAAYRNVPISDELCRELREWRLQSKFSTEDDFVFPAEHGQIMWSNQLNGELSTGANGRVKCKGAVKTACYRAGVEAIRWHDLRHHYASLQLYRDGVSLQEVAALMGHENSKITEDIYGHWIDGAAKDQDLRRRAAV